jgi:peptidoglycan/LPS O-acetylase OafA/YrhL
VRGLGSVLRTFRTGHVGRGDVIGSGVGVAVRSPPARLGRIPALDGLRCLAIVVVFFNHTEPIFGWYLRGGGLGVDLFFVLSGFLITTLLLERAGEPLRLFYVRRALRLMPALVVLLVVITAIAAVELDEGSEYLRADAWVLAYLTNWAQFFGWFHAGLYSHLWTLAVEEQFYILFPLPFLLLWHRARACVLPIMLAIILAATLWRASPIWVDDDRALRLTETVRFDEILAGSALAVVRWNGLDLRRIGRWWPGGLLVFVATIAIAPFTEHRDATYFGLAIPAVVVASVVLVAGAVTCSPRLLTYPVIVAIGVGSYSLYLWHLPIIGLAGDWDSAPASVRIVLALVGTAAASLGSYFLVERRFLRVKRHVGSTPTKAESDPLANPAAGEVTEARRPNR